MLFKFCLCRAYTYNCEFQLPGTTICNFRFLYRKKFSNKFSKGWMLNHLYLNFENLNNDILNIIDMLEAWWTWTKLPYMCIFWFTFSYSRILHHTWISVSSWWLNAVIIIYDLKSQHSQLTSPTLVDSPLRLSVTVDETLELMLFLSFWP